MDTEKKLTNREKIVIYRALNMFYNEKRELLNQFGKNSYGYYTNNLVVECCEELLKNFDDKFE